MAAGSSTSPETSTAICNAFTRIWSMYIFFCIGAVVLSMVYKWRADDVYRRADKAITEGEAVHQRIRQLYEQLSERMEELEKQKLLEKKLEEWKQIMEFMAGKEWLEGQARRMGTVDQAAQTG